MEICCGLELFDEVKRVGHFNEARAIEVVLEIVNGIYYSHSNGVIHRDLKLENIMFESLDPKAQVKIIDWGLGAKFDKDCNFLATVAGTPQFVAPEVFKGEYDSKCDIWSIGVISYVILSWKFPYKGKTVKDYLKSLEEDQISFEYEEFKDVSENCKKFILGCLKRNPEERFDIKQCYEHIWFQNFNKKLHSMTLSRDVLTKIRKYTAPSNKLQAFIQDNFINLLLMPEEINGLRDQFQAIDYDGRGMITVSELLEACKKSDSDVSEEEIKEIIKEIKKNSASNKHGDIISYSEFLMAATDKAKLIEKDNLVRLFRYFDEDNSGYIDIANLKSLLLRTMKKDRLPKDEEFSNIIHEVCNSSKKTVINLKDFLGYFGVENSL